jgi:hypothetical protein
MEYGPPPRKVNRIAVSLPTTERGDGATGLSNAVLLPRESPTGSLRAAQDLE